MTISLPQAPSKRPGLSARFLLVSAVAVGLAAGPMALPSAPAQAASAPLVVDGMNIDNNGTAVINGLERTEVTPGLVHVKYERLDGAGWQQINILKAKLSDDTVKMKYLHPETVAGPGATVTEMVERGGAVAGVNLDRFDINNSWAAAGWGITDGEIIKSANPDASASVGMTADGLGALVDLVLQGSVTFDDESSVDIGGINVFSFDTQRIALYNSLWGASHRNRGLNGAAGIEVWVGADGKVSKTAQPVAEGAIPEGTQILVAKQGTAAATRLAALQLGDTATIAYGMQDDSLDIQEAGGAWHRLVRNGAAVPGGNDEYFTGLNPRTLIGFSQDRTTAYFVVVDGRTAIARGMNFSELSALLIQLGAYDAINADGGGSSQMNVRQTGESATTVKNTPSDGYERLDGDGMGFVLAKPGSGQLTGFAVKSMIGAENGLRVFPGLHRTLKGMGHDEKNSPVARTPQRWASSQSSVATVSADAEVGIVAGHSPGTADISAASGIARGKARVQVLGKLDRLSVSENVINLEKQGSSTILTLTGHDAEGFAAPVEPQDVKVVNPEPDAITVEPTEDGRFKISAIGEQGSALIDFRHGDVSTQVSVSVPLEVRVIDDFGDISGWTTAHDRAPTGSLEQGEGHEGSASIRLNYDFTESTATRGRYAVAPGTGIDIPGRPQKLSVWIKGDGKGSLLRLQVMQANGVRNWIDGPDGNQSLHATWTGWERKDFLVPANFAFPLKLERIRVLETVAAKQYTGSMEFSQIFAYLPPDGTAAPSVERAEDPIITEAGGTDESPLRVAVMSDAQFVGREPNSAQVQGARAALREIAAAKPDLLLINGDFVDEAADADFELAKRILDEELAGTTFPWYYVPGNHEVMGSPISKFESHFGPAQRHFDVEHTRFITLDSSSLKHATAFAQVKMLREQLDDAAKNPAITGVVIVSHVPTNDPLPSKSSQISDRREAALFDDWAREFRAETGKSIAFVNGHVGVFNTRRVDGVPYVINGNSGKDPAAAPADGGFTGWTMLGIDPAEGEWQQGAQEGEASKWLSVEVEARVESLATASPAGPLTVGEQLDLAPTIVQTDAGAGEGPQGGSGGSADLRRVPVAWPISYTWAGSTNLFVGDADRAPATAIAALDPASSVLTGLRAGSGEATIVVGGETKTVRFGVTGGDASVSGSAVYGGKLTAVLGSWAKDAAASFQWLRDGTEISGATEASYSLGLADIGTVVSARITVTAENRIDVTVTAAASSPVALASQTAPDASVSGAAAVGSTLLANAGSWPSGTRLTFQWLRDGIEVPGAVSSAYLLGDADLGKRIRVRVTGFREGYADAIALSDATAAVRAGDGSEEGPEVPETVARGTVKVVGTAAVGKKLSMSSSGWQAGTVLVSRWYRDGVIIPGATGTSYTPGKGDLKHRISARVIASKPGLVSVEVASAETGPVRVGTLPSIAKPKISGKVKAGRTVSAKLGKIPAGARVGVTWLINGKAVKNAKTYRVASRDARKRLSVRVTVSKPGYTTVQKTSAAKRIKR